MTFQKQKETFIQSLDMTVQEFVHSSGMRHIHLDRKDSELGFSVGFRTVPTTSNGVPHILEHLTLSGSENYPVKDPFFLMLPRSLASFMNAMTYPDRTVYPFNTPNVQDFRNLMSVYLDATFFPKLNKLDFHREGWRYEVERTEDHQRQLTIQGVVYNEMKGVYDDPMSVQVEALSNAVFPGTTYAQNSGGDPDVIPELSHAELIQFHHDHYHPSRAVVVTYGNIAAEDVQVMLKEKVLDRFQGDVLPPIQNESFQDISGLSQQVTFQSNEEAEHSFYHVWPRSLMTDYRSTVLDYFMTDLLLTSASAPLRQKLSNLGYGQPGAFSHFEKDLFKSHLNLGFSGLQESEIPKARQDFWRILNEVAEEGVSEERLQASIRGFEMKVRNTESNTPFGFNLINVAMPQALFGGEVADALNGQAILDDLRPQLTVENAKKWLRQIIKSPNVSVDMLPDPDWLEKRSQREFDKLQETSSHFSEKDWVAIEKLQEEVLDNQVRPSNVDALPMIRVEDIPRVGEALIEVNKQTLSNHATHHHIHADGRGIAELSLVLDASAFLKDDWAWVSLWTQLATKMGTRDLTWQEHAQKLATEGEGISVRYSKLKDLNNPNDLRTVVVFSGLTLENRSEYLTAALTRLWSGINWNDIPRLQFMAQNAVKSILSSPGDLVSDDVGRGMSVFANFDSATGGPELIPFFVSLNEMLQNSPLDVVKKLTEIQAKMQHLPVLVRTIGGPQIAEAGAKLQTALGVLPAFNPETASANTSRLEKVTHTGTAWSVPQQVGEMYQTFQAPRHDSPDFAKVKVLMKVLSNGYLHTAIREKGGAYGSNASASDLIILSSYRDPRVKGTFEDFGKAIQWAQNGEFEARQVKEGILSVVKQLDTPKTPRIKAVSSWMENVSNLTPDQRQNIREALLDTTAQELTEAAQKWLSTPSSRFACLPNAKTEEAQEMGLDVKETIPSKSKKLKLG